MTMDLAHWQERLSNHFSALRDYRGSIEYERPIFGLEHGLDPAEIQAMVTALRTQIADSPPQRDHALVWIVYSSELGYRYTGDEYWQTFEEETPGWIEHGNRYWLRQCYREFEKDFGGAVPTGRWAHQFSIICWPITHAVLPTDLQRQLARVLFELRHRFSAHILESPLSLGELIAAQSWNTTSRFQNLAQETGLLGQIAAALLFQGEFGTGNLMHSATLRRIGKDLDRERRAREWLQDARNSAKSRTQVRGLREANRRLNPASTTRVDKAREEIAALGIEPKVLLRLANPLDATWDVTLELPDLSHLLMRLPEVRPILTGSRCVVAGSDGRPLARGRCLYPNQRVRLSRWPSTDEVLLQFEQTNPQLDFLLRTECLLRPGSKWLFRLALDGLAYECRSLRVRPRQKYVLISTTSPISSHELIDPIEFSCEGIYGAVIELPSSLNERWEELLKDLGLSQARTFEVWPAGLAAADWDGEGYGEWLSSEQPCLAIQSDYSQERVLISKADDEYLKLELTSIVPGEPIFVEMPKLPAGHHTFRVCVEDSSNKMAILEDLEVSMQIREPRPWLPNEHSATEPLSLELDPPVPSLEELWESKVAISIHGPRGRVTKCRVSMFEREGKTPAISKQLPNLAIPFDAHHWRTHFSRHFQNPGGQAKKKTQEVYDISRRCQLEFDADELGSFTVIFEREFTPLRWVFRRHGANSTLVLLNDTGDAEEPTVSHRTFEEPFVDLSLPCASEYEIPSAGAMYIAHRGDFRASIIVPPPVIRDFKDLRCQPEVKRQQRSLASVIDVLEVANLWGGARLTGDVLALNRQRDVVSSLVREVFCLLCGDKWESVEDNSANDLQKAFSLRSALSKYSGEAEVGKLVTRDVESLSLANCVYRVQHLAGLTEQYRLLSAVVHETSLPQNISTTKWCSELALRLASNPAQVIAWAGHHLNFGLDCLMQNPVLARLARFVVLATDQYLGSKPESGELYASWRWD